MQTREALGISRGSETPSCEEHYTVISNKDKDILVNPLNKDILVYHCFPNMVINILLKSPIK